MKKELINLQKRLWINICNLLYDIPGESVMKLYDEMSSRVDVGSKVKGGSTIYRGVENHDAKAENGKIMF